tara:strand:- start:395 stop:649 length:255 start_codon:yes stop_codon:yes gene_type:complete
MNEKIKKNYPNTSADINLKKESQRKVKKPIDQHGNYEGTDVGFTSNLGQGPKSNKSGLKKENKQIDKHGNYDGTDVGFTADFEE